MKERACKECNGPVHGRLDKKFCSDYCRNTFHNKENTENGYMRKVNSILRKNRKILKAFNPTGKSKTNKARLLEQGFSFEFYTSTYTNKAGSTYYFCYEHGYLPLDNDWFALVVKQERKV